MLKINKSPVILIMGIGLIVFLCIVTLKIFESGNQDNLIGPQDQEEKQRIPKEKETDNTEIVFEGRLFEVATSKDLPIDWGGGDFLGLKYKLIKVYQAPEKDAPYLTIGQQMNVVVTKPDVKRKGFTQRTGTVKTFNVGDVHRLRVTQKLPKGWEAIKLEFAEMSIGLLACLSADIVENTDDEVVQDAVVERNE